MTKEMVNKLHRLKGKGKNKGGLNFLVVTVHGSDMCGDTRSSNSNFEERESGLIAINK